MRVWPRQTARPGRAHRGRARCRTAGQARNNLVWNVPVRSGHGLLSRRPPKVTALHELTPQGPTLCVRALGETN
jgi:hypothetical protein